MPFDLAIDRRLDARKLAPIFARSGRLHLPGIFDPAAAERILRSLAGDTPWQRTLNSGDKGFRIPRADWDALPATARAETETAVAASAAHGFQFAYDSYDASGQIAAGRRLGIACEAVHDFVNSEDFLSFARVLTGEPRIACADAQATRYGPGDFLTEHSDDIAGTDRLYAYVLNLTPGWRADWGGLLLFLDEDGHVAEGYTPAFNALNIFRVPQRHCVSAVAAFAPRDRYAVTGWLKGA